MRYWIIYITQESPGEITLFEATHSQINLLIASQRQGPGISFQYEKKIQQQ